MADCVEAGVCKAMPGVEVLKVPMVDGGEGFTRTLVNVTGGTIQRLTVTGPLGEPVEAHYVSWAKSEAACARGGIGDAFGGRVTASSTRGPEPSGTTAYGVGELNPFAKVVPPA